VEGVHIRDVLDAVATQNPGLIEKFGGHAMAAGLTLDAARYAQFTQAFDAAVSAHCAGREWSAHRYSDGELGAAEFDLDTARALRGGGPWGQGFPEPAFDGEFTLLETRLVGERHLKMRLRAATGGAPIDGIQFGYLGGEFDVPSVRSGSRVRLLYKLEVNEYNGSERLQLNCAGLMPL
jgi:single-stranded-DNA-specific exonuclease